jgi:hypothetical protein
VNNALTSIDRARRYLEKVPGAVSGQNGHKQTFTVALALVNGFALSEPDAFALLSEYNRTCQPPWTEKELWHKVRSAAGSQHSKPRGHLLGKEGRPAGKLVASIGFSKNRSRPAGQLKSQPRLDPVTATEVFLGGFQCGEADLWEASPIRPPEDWRQDGLALVEHLYRPGELINFVTRYALDKDGKARPDGAGETVERDALLACWARDGMPQSDAGGWLRMNPVTGHGVADANVTAFRFALVECDALPLKLQLPLLARLPLPIAAILTSAGRSLHAWIYVDADTADEFRPAVGETLTLLGRHFGVDTKNCNAGRLSRLPGVVRRLGAEGDGKQRLLYLNPNPEQKAIL